METDPSHDDIAGRATSSETPTERSTLFIVLVLTGIVASSTIIALLSGETAQRNPEGARTARQSEPTHRRATCSELRAAAGHLAVGDQIQFVEAIERAGRMAENALQRSGVVFGPSDRVALELSAKVSSSETTTQSRLARRLMAGIEACPQPSGD